MDSLIDTNSRDNDSRTILKVLFIFLILLASPQLVLATHEADHRYVISGYVRNAEGIPIQSAELLLEHKGGEKKKVKTNSQGYYEILFHLHNSSLGGEIVVKYGEIAKNHKIQFDPEDKFTNRGAEIDFGSPGKEDPRKWIYLAGVILVVSVSMAYSARRRKNKIIKKNEMRKSKKRRKR